MFSGFQQRERPVGQGKRIRRSAAVWRELIAQQLSSGLTVPQFCRREGLNASVFWRWRLRLKRDTEGGEVRARSPAVPVSAAPFIDLGDLRSGGSRLEVRLDLGAGVVLSIARG
jgi:transposase-like protein